MKDEQKQGRGGKRKGAGRPTEVKDGVRPFRVTLDEKTAKALRFIGEGNMSAGIRQAAKFFIDSHK